jgi:hypothetical protein
METYTHNFSPGMKITVDKMKILGITIPTNEKYEDLIIFLEFLHIKEINKEKSDIFDEHHEIQNKIV